MGHIEWCVKEFTDRGAGNSFRIASLILQNVPEAGLLKSMVYGFNRVKPGGCIGRCITCDHPDNGRNE